MTKIEEIIERNKKLKLAFLRLLYEETEGSANQRAYSNRFREKFENLYPDGNYDAIIQYLYQKRMAEISGDGIAILQKGIDKVEQFEDQNVTIPEIQYKILKEVLSISMSTNKPSATHIDIANNLSIPQVRVGFHFDELIRKGYLVEISKNVNNINSSIIEYYVVQINYKGNSIVNNPEDIEIESAPTSNINTTNISLHDSSSMNNTGNIGSLGNFSLTSGNIDQNLSQNLDLILKSIESIEHISVHLPNEQKTQTMEVLSELKNAVKTKEPNKIKAAYKSLAGTFLGISILVTGVLAPLKVLIDFGNATLELGQKLEKIGIDVPLLPPIKQQIDKISGNS